MGTFLFEISQWLQQYAFEVATVEQIAKTLKGIQLNYVIKGVKILLDSDQ